MPGVAILPHPVFPAGFDRDRWWSGASVSLVTGEMVSADECARMV